MTGGKDKQAVELAPLANKAGGWGRCAVCDRMLMPRGRHHITIIRAATETDVACARLAAKPPKVGDEHAVTLLLCAEHYAQVAVCGTCNAYAEKGLANRALVACVRELPWRLADKSVVEGVDVADLLLAHRRQRCRDGYQQARPLTPEEVMELIGE